MWRCGRCGLGVGYEVEGEDGGGVVMGGEKGEGRSGKERVIFLLEGGLVETGEMGEGVGLGE